MVPFKAVTNNTFIGESSISFGGSIVPEGNSDSRFYNCLWVNCTSNFGGTIDTGSTSTTQFWDSLVVGSSGQRGGAVFHYDNDRTQWYRVAFINCTSSANGGAIVVSTQCAPMYVNCTFVNNYASGVGGAIYSESFGSTYISGATILNNTALGGGGGVYARGTALYQIYNSVILNNSALYGGGVLLEEKTSIVGQNITCSDNVASLEGGGYKIVDNSSLSLASAVIFNNTAGTLGGGMQVDVAAVVNLTRVSFLSNIAATQGGGLSVTGANSQTVVTQCQFIQNQCALSGGGISVDSAANLTITNSTLFSNTAVRGGGFYADSSTGFSATSLLLSNNNAQFGGAMFFASLALNNYLSSSTLVGNNASAGACYFYDVWSRLLNFTNIMYVGNTALYGVIEATKPYRLQNLTVIGPSYSPKDSFSIELVLLDYFNNVCYDTPSQIIVQVTGSPGLTVQSTILKAEIQGGYATFDNLGVLGTLGSIHNLQVIATNLPTLKFPIQIVSCGPGYTKVSLPGDPYRCVICSANYYSLIPDTACLACPSGGDCLAGGSTIYALAGFWMDPDSLAALSPQFYACEPGNCGAKSTCALNRQGRLCSECIPGYSEWNNQCQNCSQQSPGWMLLPLFAGCVYAAFLIRFPRLTEAGIPKSLVFFIEAAVILLQSDSQVSAQSVVQMFNFAFEWVINLDFRSKCVLELSVLQKVAYEYYSPLTPFLGIFICFIVMRIYFLIAHGSKIPDYWRWRILASLLWVSLWSYILVAKTSFKLVNCIQVGNAYVLNAAPNVLCNSPTHRPYQAVGTFTNTSKSN